MTPVFLPIEGVTWLCKSSGTRTQALVPAPGSADAVWRIASDGSEFGMLDQSGKRLGHYRILDQAPWMETVSPPATLPRNCVAHDLLVHQGLLIAGGHSGHGEALWIRQPSNSPSWQTLALPEGVGRRGKAVDALFLRDRELVAVDNILLPKWILVYPMDPTLDGCGVRKFHLATHTTYENIACAAEGPEVYALYSRGYNHGITSYFISLVRKSDLLEVAYWSGHREQTTQELIRDVSMEMNMEDDSPAPFESEPDDLAVICAALKVWKKSQERSKRNIGGMLARVLDMAFCGNCLLLAVGRQGIAFTKLPSLPSAQGNTSRRQLAGFLPFKPLRLASVSRLRTMGRNGEGLFAIGPDANGVLCHEWIALDQLIAAPETF